MPREKLSSAIVKTGNIDGMDTIYDRTGRLVQLSNESVLRVADGWDMEACMDWRRFLPKILFEGFNGPVTSRLYVTTQRVVLVRNIDVWRETKSDMSALGIPGGVAKAVDLKRLASLGAREYCAFDPKRMRVVRLRRLKKLGSWLDFYLIGDDGLKYEILIWKAEGEDLETTTVLESRFGRQCLVHS